MGARISYNFLLKIIILLVIILGFYGRMYPSGDENAGWDLTGRELHEHPEDNIAYYLAQRELCREGVIYPDSAVCFTVEALKIAEECYGRESEKYSEIFTDCFIDDIKKFKQLIVEEVCPNVDIFFNSKFESTRRAYYKLARILISYHEDYLATRFLTLSIDNPIDEYQKLEAQIQLATLLYSSNIIELEEILLNLETKIQNLPSPDKEELKIYMIKTLFNSISKNGGEVTNLEKYIKEGDQLVDMVSTSDAVGYLISKYKLLLSSNHYQAMLSMDKALKLAEQGELLEQDREWLASLLVSKGDYYMNEALNVGMAVPFYGKALALMNKPNDVYSGLYETLTLRLMQILIMGGEYIDAIALGEKYMPILFRSKELMNGEYVVLALCNAYVQAGRLKDAENLLAEHHELLFSTDRTREKESLCRAEVYMAKNDMENALRVLKELEVKDLSMDTQIWKNRYLVKIYSRLNREEKFAYADSILINTKNIIASQMWSVIPALRKQWLCFCEEAIESLLECTDNPKALKNAAELNLFRKSLLFRTSSVIEDIVSADSIGSTMLDSIKNLRIELNNPLPYSDAEKLIKGIEEKEYGLINTIVDKHELQKHIDLDIDSVILNYDDKSLIIDFYYYSTHNKNRLGAFIYSKIESPRFLVVAESLSDPIYIKPDELWRVLYPFIKKYERVCFSADGILQKIPIEYFMHGIEEEEKELHRMFHPAKPYFNINMGDEIEFWGISDHNSPVNRKAKILRKDWTDLNQVEAELHSIKSRLMGKKLKTFLNDDATEEQFIRKDHSSTTLLHISTHGMYLSQDSVEEAANDTTSFTHFISVRALPAHNQSFSSLIFRRGNQTRKRKDLNEDFDDILTAEEIELMKFPNLNLAVLSACDTGLGEIDSEGIWGLQRAFRIAGAKNLICALSEIDDYWTAQFMDAFYEQAAAGNNIYDSFHAAQRWLRRELPDNPEIWSSFILIE